jgi:multiple sugar transport system permease protein
MTSSSQAPPVTRPQVRTGRIGQPASTPRTRRRGPVLLQRIPTYVILLFGTLLMVLPLLWMITTSLASTKYVTTFPPKLIPDSFQVANYVRIFSDAGLGRYLVNSVAIVIPSMVAQVVASSFAGYALARLRAPGRRIWFVITLCTLMIPYEVTIVPTFVMFRHLGWINTSGR